MAELLQFLVEYGYIVIFIWVLLDQAGLPLPAVPLMLASGALAGMDQLSAPLIIAVALMASVPVDLFWYLLGRARGGKVLNLLCAISLEPDYCVRNTEAIFNRLGSASLVVGKFIPGLQTLAPPMAGLTGISLGRFLVLDSLGAFVWSALFTLIGYALHTELEQVATITAELGVWTGLILCGLVVLYLGNKFLQRRKFLRSLRMRRLNPQEVYERLEKDDTVHVLDLRHSYDFDQLPVMIPSAVRVPMEAIDRHLQNIPGDDDIILYCS